jgi:hypothetical protein
VAALSLEWEDLNDVVRARAAPCARTLPTSTQSFDTVPTPRSWIWPPSLCAPALRSISRTMRAGG